MDAQEIIARAKGAPVTATVAGLIVGFYILGNLSSTAADELALVPANTIMVHFYIWNIVTAGLFQYSFVEMVYSVAGVIALGTYVEPILGHFELARFLFVTNILNGAFAFFLYVFLFILTRVEYFLYRVKICGSDGILIAMLMAIAQHKPTEPVPFLKFIKMQQMPLLWLCFEITVFAVFQPPILDLPMVCTGFYYSWWYLRFVRKHPDGTIGDYNEEFSFVKMFPAPLHRFIAPVCNFLFAVCKLMGFFKDRASRELEAVANKQMDVVVDVPEPGSLQEDISQLLTFEQAAPTKAADPVAERRRARAMKALDERLAALNAEPEMSLDEIIDDADDDADAADADVADADDAGADDTAEQWKSEMPGVPSAAE